MGDKNNTYMLLAAKPEGKETTGRKKISMGR
jgi:hypothetical protein